MFYMTNNDSKTLGSDKSFTCIRRWNGGAHEKAGNVSVKRALAVVSADHEEVEVIVDTIHELTGRKKEEQSSPAETKRHQHFYITFLAAA